MMFVSHFFSLNSSWRLMAILLAVAAATVTVAPVSAQTASDLFEKAVYADETAGDMDKAIELYGQVIAKTKQANGIAAEAQYRLGICLGKQDKPNQAREAFQAVVDGFPQETKFVTLAKNRLPGALELLPVPWRDGEQLHMTITLPTGKKIGKRIFSIDATQYNGQPAWRCSTRELILGGNSFSEVFCDKQTFAPLASHWKHSVIGTATATYNAGKATIEIVSRDKPVVLDFSDPAYEIAIGYDNEQCAHVFRRLPLEVGLDTELAVISTLGGSVVPLAFDVPRKKTITTAAGTFECYQLELDLGQTFWISDDADRYLVRIEVGTIDFDLTRIEQRKKGQGTEFEQDQFAITLPDGWFLFDSEQEDDGAHDGGKRVIHLLDRRAITNVTLTIEAKDSLKEEEKTSVQAWSESIMKSQGKQLKNFKLRDEGIIPLKIEEQEAATVVFDYQQGKKRMTGYGVALFGEKWAATLLFLLPADQYESLRDELETLTGTLRVK